MSPISPTSPTPSQPTWPNKTQASARATASPRAMAIHSWRSGCQMGMGFIHRDAPDRPGPRNRRWPSAIRRSTGRMPEPTSPRLPLILGPTVLLEGLCVNRGPAKAAATVGVGAARSRRRSARRLPAGSTDLRRVVLPSTLAAPWSARGLPGRAAHYHLTAQPRRITDNREREGAIMAEIDWRLSGIELLTCNCDYGCPCQFNALPTQGDCRAAMACRIDKGHFG